LWTGFFKKDSRYTNVGPYVHKERIGVRRIVGATQDWVARGDRISDPRNGCGMMRNRRATEKTPAAKKIVRIHTCIYTYTYIRFRKYVCL